MSVIIINLAHGRKLLCWCLIVSTLFEVRHILRGSIIYEHTIVTRSYFRLNQIGRIEQ